MLVTYTIIEVLRRFSLRPPCFNIIFRFSFKVRLCFIRLKARSHIALMLAFAFSKMIEATVKVHSNYAFFCIFVCDLHQTQRMGSILILCV